MSESIAIWRTTKCCHCSETFAYKYAVTAEQLKQNRIVVKMTCPYCKRKLSVDLAYWKVKEITLSRGVDEITPEAALSALRLPDELPTELSTD